MCDVPLIRSQHQTSAVQCSFISKSEAPIICLFPFTNLYIRVSQLLQHMLKGLQLFFETQPLMTIYYNSHNL